MIESVNGIEYNLQEDIRIRAISQSEFELKKGIHHLNGEEIVALLMDATNGRSIDEETFVYLMQAVMEKIKSEITEEQRKELMTEIESNISFEQIFEKQPELPTIQFVSLTDGIVPTMKDDIYYIEFEKEFLKSVSEELTTFD